MSAARRNLLFHSFCTVFLATLAVPQLPAQPAVCPPGSQTLMTPFCEEACVICDIDGFSGRNGRDEDYFLPDDFCTEIQHNGKWIGFIAGSEDLTVRLSVSNCELNFGLEIAIYEAIDCDNYTVVSNCFGGFNSIAPGTSGIFSNTQPLVVGQYYYMVMDGGLDDVCDWQFSVLSGTTAVAPLTSSGPISGPLVVCPDTPVGYQTAVETGAANFSWTVGGTEVASGIAPEIIWNQTGTFELCVTASNACDSAPPACAQVLVREIPLIQIDTFFCSDEVFAFADTLITDAGQYNFSFSTNQGCDSNFVLNLVEVRADSVLLDLHVCQEDTFQLNDQFYTQSGDYVQTLTNQFGCDSTLLLSLEFIDCNLVASAAANRVSCPGYTDGSIAFEISSGDAPFSFRLQNLEGDTIRSGPLFIAGSFLLGDLAPGQFQFILTDRTGAAIRIFNLFINEPPPVVAALEVTDYAGFEVSCFGNQDGQIEIVPTGGRPPYTIEWADDDLASFVRSGLPAGVYRYEIKDFNRCPLIDSIILQSPTEISAEFNFEDPDCSGPETGQIIVNEVNGGAGGYQYALNDNDPIPTGFFDQLPANDYRLKITDQNGCSLSVDSSLVGSLIPQIVLTSSSQLIRLGQEALIRVNVANAESWTISGDSSFYNILETGQDYVRLLPLQSGNVSITAISEDGCTALDSIRISIDAERRIFAPNAFSPNGDGINDDFQLYFGNDVAAVEALRVFDRWGGLRFEKNASSESWDGADAPAGVYVWSARIRFIDGKVSQEQGSVLLIR